MNIDESMLDVYIYETQCSWRLWKILFEGESEKALGSDHINEFSVSCTP